MVVASKKEGKDIQDDEDHRVSANRRYHEGYDGPKATG